ncbi:MAG: LysM peptidoglycan-binding domain-containing protein [Lachnospiraceae bacterium]|nr:LysM peptidoglycan-binding domain-containing protein [Lachnospiraceae bacterium]
MEKDNINQDSSEYTNSSDYGDSKYYSKLYDDLPKEIVELLMKEHPLMDDGKKTESIRLYNEETSEGKAEDFIEKDAETDATFKFSTGRFDSSRVKRENEETISRMFDEKKKSSASKDNMDDDDYIQIIKHKEPIMRNRKTIPRQYDAHEGEAFSSTKNQMERTPPKPSREPRNTEEAYPKKQRVKRHPVDYEKMTKEDALNEFFSNNKNKYDDYEDDVLGKTNKYFLIAAVVLVCLTAFFTFRSISLSGKLAKVNASVSEYEKMASDYNQLKLEKIALDEEASGLRVKAEKYDELMAGQAETSEGGEASGNQASSGQTTGGQTTGSYSTYTVTAGDTFWGIAEKTYGNGVYFSRILEANGLTENSGLQIGQTLKIPK